MMIVACLLFIGCTQQRQSEAQRSSKGVKDNDFAATPGDADYHLEITTDPKDPTVARVVVFGEGEDWFPAERLDDAAFCRQVLALYLARDDDTVTAITSGDATPVLGRYAWDEGKLIFVPRFDLAPGQRYVARFDAAALADAPHPANQPQIVEYTVSAASPEDRPQVVAVYPSGGRLPANHLKFYIVFDRAMQRGDIFRHFRLFDLTAGREVPGPFRLTELWSREERRLTLWFHPGRQKEGVNLNLEFGPILDAGHRYRLEVSGAWKSAEGQSLGQDFEKTFEAIARDRTQPDPKTWEMRVPRRGTRDPLDCRFREPLDWALLLREIHVENAAGEHVAGDVSTSDGETAWQFQPRDPWAPGDYRLAVGAVLEDLAGNSIERPFERDVNEESTSERFGIVYRSFAIDAD